MPPRFQAMLGSTLVIALVIVTVILGAPATASAAPGFTPTCEQALPKDDVDALLERMRAADLDSPCALQRVDTSLYQTRIGWRRDAANVEVLLGPRGCVLEPSAEGADLAFYAPAELAQLCPKVLAEVEDFVGEPVRDLVPVVRGQAPKQVEEMGAGAGWSSPLWLATAAWILALVLAGLGAGQRWRALRELPELRREALHFGIACALMFALGLGARAHVVASLGNWYGAFLPAEGWGELRFGASAALLQALVRAVTPWSEQVAFAVVRITGALAVPLVMLVARRLGASLVGAVLAGLILAVAPIPVRLSASSSEHVLAGTLALAAWAVWLRTPGDRSWVPRVASLALVCLAVLARVDCFIQLALIPLWTVLARPPRPASIDEDLGDPGGPAWAPLDRRLGDAGFFALAWGALGIYAYFAIVVPSNHPGPELEGVRYTARVLFSQLWIACVEPPHWITPTTLALVVLGCLALAAQRRLGFLLAAVLGWALIFVPLGRNLTHDGLTGARYFVLALPVLALVAAQAGELGQRGLNRALVGVGDPLRRRWLGAGATLGAGAGILVAALVSAQPGWRHTYTFQAEYLVLAEELAAMEPAAREGCTLWFVRPRQPTGEPDLDCCLAPDRSPLRLVAPQLRFRPMPNARPPADEEGCHLYYVGSLCSIDPELAPRVPEGVGRIHAQCEALRSRPDSIVIERREVTDATLNRRFTSPPLVELRSRERRR